MTGQLGLETFAAPATVLERREDGSMLLQSSRPLSGWAPSVASAFREHALRAPDRPLALQRVGDTWSGVSYSQARRTADALAQAFLDLGLSASRPIMVLSGNSVEHLLVALGALTAGVPLMPISAAYSLVSSSHERIKHIAERTAPGLIFADDATAFASALDALSHCPAEVLIARGARAGALHLADLERCAPTAAVDEALANLEPTSIAKLLFTSGSTGIPKGVINTQRMLCANQAMTQAVWPFLAEEPPVMVDWLPWSHTFGGNHNVNLALFNGGTLYIDDGKPTPALFPRTLEALSEVAPTVYFNVPAGYAMLTPALEADRGLAEHFFSRLRFMLYAAAALPEPIAQRLRRLASEVADHAVPLTSAWGATETAPGVTSAHFSDAVSGCIGVPLPGTTVKLAPVADKLEARVMGPNVTPGYFGEPELSSQAFDEEGFYRTGDAVRLVDQDDPNRGLLFDGRIAEDFKLVTGTWVTVGTLRTTFLGAAQVLSDAVICGHNESFVSALAWVNQAEARKVLGRQDDVELDDEKLRQHLAAALTRLNEQAGSSARIERLLLLDRPPSLDEGEITDKGYLNQRVCLERRSAEVDVLYAAEVHAPVICPNPRDEMPQ
jgi:feruloyl-CoA synthase